MRNCGLILFTVFLFICFVLLLLVYHGGNSSHYQPQLNQTVSVRDQVSVSSIKRISFPEDKVICYVLNEETYGMIRTRGLFCIKKDEGP
jgi:hypothetical protein